MINVAWKSGIGLCEHWRRTGTVIQKSKRQTILLSGLLPTTFDLPIDPVLFGSHILDSGF